MSSAPGRGANRSSMNIAMMTKAHEPTSDRPMGDRAIGDRPVTDRASDPLAELPAPRSSMLQWLRTRCFELVILAWCLPFGVVILSFFQVWRSPVHVRRALRLWSTGFISAARWIVGVRYTIEGRENVPERPVIFICNHQSYWESIAFTVLIPHLNIISKAEAMDIPVFGWGLRHAPMIPVYRDDRGSNLRRIVREAQKSLAEGRSILLFPEGTRVKPGQTRTFERSLELLYLKCNVQIVPIAHNAGLCWTEGFASKAAGLITMRFYPPITAGLDPKTVAHGIEQQLNREKDALVDQVSHRA
jgi:1-acyl-sn-glycerol-3-phosphate acyltransferase